MPGVYRYVKGTDDAAGVFRLSDMAWIPPEPANADWRAYKDWLISAGDNSVDAAVALELPAVKLRAKSHVDRQAEAELGKRMSSLGGAWGLAGAGSNMGFAMAELRREAFEIETDGTPTAAEYPILNALIAPLSASDLADAGSIVRGQWDAVEVEIANVMAVQRYGHIQIDAATTAGAVQSVVDSVDWPIIAVAVSALTRTRAPIVVSGTALIAQAAPATASTATVPPGVEGELS